MVFRAEMRSLIAPVAMHAVGIDHEIEGFSLFLQFVDQLERVLEMDVVIARSVGDFQPDAVRGLVLPDMVDDARIAVAIRIGLRGLHEAFGVVRVIEGPVIDPAARNAVGVFVRGGKDQHGGHGSAKREALYANLIGLYIGEGLQPFGPFHEVTYFDGIQMLINLVEVLATTVSGGAAIQGGGDDAVLGIPGVGLLEASAHEGRIRPSVQIHMDGIMLIRIESVRIDHCSVERGAVFRGKGNDLGQAQAGCLEVRALLICNYADLLRFGYRRGNQFRRICVVGQHGGELLPVG